MSDAVWLLVTSCWAHTAADRPSARRVVETLGAIARVPTGSGAASESSFAIWAADGSPSRFPLKSPPVSFSLSNLVTFMDAHLSAQHNPEPIALSLQDAHTLHDQLSAQDRQELSLSSFEGALWVLQSTEDILEWPSWQVKDRYIQYSVQDGRMLYSWATLIAAETNDTAHPRGTSSEDDFDVSLQLMLMLLGKCPYGRIWLPFSEGYLCGCGKHKATVAQVAEMGYMITSRNLDEHVMRLHNSVRACLERLLQLKEMLKEPTALKTIPSIDSEEAKGFRRQQRTLVVSELMWLLASVIYHAAYVAELLPLPSHEWQKVRAEAAKMSLLFRETAACALVWAAPPWSGRR